MYFASLLIFNAVRIFITGMRYHTSLCLLLPVVKEKVSTFDYETPNMMFGVWYTAHQLEMNGSKIKI